MQGIGRSFFTAALIYGVAGMVLGLHMAITENHGQMPTHAHVMVIGWLSFAVFGMFYASYGGRAPRLLSHVHFWLAQISMAGLAIGLGIKYAGITEPAPIAPVSAIAYALSFVLFAAVALMAVRRPALQVDA